MMIRSRRTVLFLLVLFPFISPMAEALCARENKVLLRKGPGKKFAESWVVGQYMPFERIASKGEWIKVRDVDSAIHWGHMRIFTKAVRCVVVKAPYAVLRKGPGSKFEKAIVENADKYKPFKYLKSRKGWVHVEDDKKRQFWLRARDVWEAKTYHRVSF